MFQYFRQEGETGDGPKITHGIRIESRFFEDEGDSSQFERSEVEVMTAF